MKVFFVGILFCSMAFAGDFLVGYKPGQSKEAKLACQRHGLKVIEDVSGSFLECKRVAGKKPKLDALRKEPSIRYVEKDEEVRIQ